MNNVGEIRQSLKKRFDRINNESLKNNVLQAMPFWIASGITGIIAVVYARLFAMAESATLMITETYRWMIFILAPLFFFLAWWIVQRFSPTARGSGIPQVMAAIELANPKENSKVDSLLSLKVIVVKVCSSLLMVVGGGVVGREGPTIQIAGSIFRWVNNLIPASWPKISKRNMIMTGAAAGLAAAFNTPLGGIVFAVEELTKTHFRYFRTAIFSAVIIAGLTAQGLLGPYLYLGFPDMFGLSWYIILVVIIVAVVSGLAGSSMARLIVKLLAYKKQFSFRKQVVYLFATAIVISAFSFFFTPLAAGSGKEIMTSTLFTDNKIVAWYLPVLRFAGTILSFCVGAAGGVFAPALAAGASVGSVMAGWFNMAGSNANILILAGMVSFLTGITRSPFTSAILVLEMTDRHNVIFHLMAAAMVANLVSMIIDRRSLYDHLKDGYLEEAGHDIKKGNDPPPAESY
ncbi:MAG: chloride channel protein [Bacteroidota bacterium]